MEGLASRAYCLCNKLKPDILKYTHKVKVVKETYIENPVFNRLRYIFINECLKILLYIPII